MSFSLKLTQVGRKVSSLELASKFYIFLVYKPVKNSLLSFIISGSSYGLNSSSVS